MYNAKPNFPPAKIALQLMLVICAVFTVYFPVLQRNIRSESNVRVWWLCMRVRVSECEGVLHGHVPLMLMNHKVLQLCSLVSMRDLSPQS